MRGVGRGYVEREVARDRREGFDQPDVIGNTVRRIARDRALGRDYRVDDLTVLAAFGGASGCMAVFVLAFYINSPNVDRLYTDPEAIWLLCPMLLYWICRVWLKTWRGELNEDPVVFALSDRASRWILAAAGAVLLLAR